MSNANSYVLYVIDTAQQYTSRQIGEMIADECSRKGIASPTYICSGTSGRTPEITGWQGHPWDGTPLFTIPGKDNQPRTHFVVRGDFIDQQEFEECIETVQKALCGR